MNRKTYYIRMTKKDLVKLRKTKVMRKVVYGDKDKQLCVEVEISEIGSKEIEPSKLPKEPILAVWRRWKETHEAKDFDALYQHHEPLLSKTLLKYPENIQTEIYPRLIGIYIESLHTYDLGHKATLDAWVWINSTKLSRTAGRLMYPGIPESQWHKQRQKVK